MRLSDLEAITGIAAARIGAAERGAKQLHPAEQRMVTNFLREKLAAFMADEHEHSLVHRLAVQGTTEAG